MPPHSNGSSGSGSNSNQQHVAAVFDVVNASDLPTHTQRQTHKSAANTTGQKNNGRDKDIFDCNKLSYTLAAAGHYRVLVKRMRERSVY